MPEFEDDFEPQQPHQRGPRATPPNRIAETIMGEHELATDAATGTTYHYTGTHWAEAPDGWLRHLALVADGNQISSARRRGEIVDFMKARTTRLDLKWGRVGDNEVPCLNGVVDVLSYELRPHDPADFLERVIPWRFELATAPRCEAWQAALETWFGDDERGAGLISAVQEFCGYALLPHARYKRAMICYGENSNTGKSRLTGTLMGLVGAEYTCSLSVQDMDDPQRRAVIVGKGLNIATELTTEVLRADSGFKTLVSTEEPILIDQKYRPAFMYLPTAKHVFATNVLPRLTEHAESILNRLLLVPMERIIADEQQDRDLGDTLRAEMAGILVWAIEGARRLVARGGHWELPLASREAVQSYREAWNPAVAFLLENCEPVGINAAGNMTGEIVSVLNHKFNKWNEGPRVGPKRFSNMLRRAGYEVRKVRHGEQVLSTLVGWRWVDRPSNESVLVKARDVVTAAPGDAIELQGTIRHVWRGEQS